jgi:DNA-binding NtrC family response regulator
MNLLVQGGSPASRAEVARTFHDESRLRRGPFVTLRCGAESERLTRALLLGSLRTNPSFDDPFRASEGGTLFLDEIERLAHAAQRLLQELLRRGRSQAADDSGWAGRLAAGSNEDIGQLAARGRFHAPLFDSLDKIRIDLALHA